MGEEKLKNLKFDKNGIPVSSKQNPQRQLCNVASRIRQNYHEECEDGVNKQINMELYASYVYLSMAYHFDRDDVALDGFHKYFKDMSDEEKEHAKRLMKFQNERGGKIILKDIKCPRKGDWGSSVEAMEEALELEKSVNESLLTLHRVASEHGDAQMCDFLEVNYLTAQVEDIKRISGYITNLKRVGQGLGEHVFDREFQ